MLAHEWGPLGDAWSGQSSVGLVCHPSSASQRSTRAGKAVLPGGVCEGSAEDGAVTAESAGDVERDLMGFAVPTVMLNHDAVWIARIGMEPSDTQVRALMCCLGAGGGFMPASGACA